MMTTRSGRRLRQRLATVQQELKRTRANERVLVEQVAHLQAEADDAEVRRLVANTPIADREWEAAAKDHDNHARLLAEARARLAELDAERDRLLDELLEKGSDDD